MNLIFFYYIANLFEGYFKRSSSFLLQGKIEGRVLSVSEDDWTANIFFSGGKLPTENFFTSGEVFQTVGKNCPLQLSDRVSVCKKEDGFIVRLKTEQMEPETLVRRFMRPGEIEEAEKLYRSKNFYCEMIPYVGVVTLIPTAFLFATGENVRGIVAGIVFFFFLTLFTVLARIKESQLKQVID